MESLENKGQVQNWIRSALENRGIDAEKTLYYCKGLYEYARKTNDETLLGFSSYYMGEAYYILNNVDKLFESLSLALAYLDRSGQWELLARSYNLLAITSVNRGNAPLAMDYYLSALSYCEKYHMQDVGIIVNMNIGALYNWLGEYSQAQQYYEIAYQTLGMTERNPDYYTYLLTYYIGIGNTYLYREFPEKASVYIQKAEEECRDRLGKIEEIALFCFKARCYNSMGHTKERDACIVQIHGMMQQPMEFLSVFDDLYAYCEMLFQIGKKEDFLVVLSAMEKLAASAGITHIRKQLLSLKIHYYKVAGETENYKEAAAQYFELAELMENENRYTVLSMINIRNFLEESAKQRKEIEEQNRILQKRSETDALTGMNNRFRLNEYAEEAFLRALQDETPLAVEILDIDYFKQYNDHYGHQAGDDCIRQIADCIRELTGETGIFCARYGGDEFILIYERYTKERVMELTRELRENIIALRMEHISSLGAPYVTISQGICYDMPKEGSKIWDFLHTADGMLYQVKEKERSSICIGGFGEQDGEIYGREEQAPTADSGV